MTGNVMLPLDLLRPRRKILGISAVLLPFLVNGEIDWQSLRALLERTLSAGLMPAVNMDTGYGNFLNAATKQKVLQLTREVMAGACFAAGAGIPDHPGEPFQRAAYLQQLEAISMLGGVPVVCQSFGLTGLGEEELMRAYEDLGRHCQRFIAFELGTQFAPFGAIYPMPVYERIMLLPTCMGAKHSSLNRQLEWDRLRVRDRMRPEFHVFTGNDLAIDMVLYGSDYLLGLAAFAPDVFARRDAAWAAGDPEFFRLNDALQFLGAFAFRDPVPAYKHSAAQFLHLRGWISSSAPHPHCPRRPESDLEILRGIGSRLEVW
jgi:dihydrodipicolinate synthase/N-acetylneuraminate lyase